MVQTGAARVPEQAAQRKRDDGKYEHVELTAEQIHELLDSPHISYVSRKSVSYTKAFKEHFWQRYCDGVDPKQIFEDAGLNTAILTKKQDQWSSKNTQASERERAFLYRGQRAAGRSA